MQGFFERVEKVFARAGGSAGFLATDDGSWGPRAWPEFFAGWDKRLAQTTLSLWTDLESVCAFAYRGAHMEAFKKRRQWAQEGDWPSYAAWWVDDEHVPTPGEACRRIQTLHERGPSPFAFDFKEPFDPSGRPRELDRERFHDRVRQNEIRFADEE